jgi:hypothetical protein
MMSVRTRAAYHEASHAVAALTFAIPVHHVTIDSATPHLLRGRYRPPAGIGLECLVTMCLAGPIGEQYCCGPINDRSDEVDYQMARRYLARQFDPLRVEVEIGRARDAAGRLVRDQQARIRLIADALLQHGALSGADIDVIIPATLT